MKIVMSLMLLAVLGALASAGVLMMRRGGRDPSAEDDDGKPADKGMARALALRVALSIGLFLFILLSWYMGWVKPGGIPVGA